MSKRDTVRLRCDPEAWAVCGALTERLGSGGAGFHQQFEASRYFGVTYSLTDEDPGAYIIACPFCGVNYTAIRKGVRCPEKQRRSAP